METTFSSLGDSPSSDAVTNLARDVRTCSEIAEPGGYGCCPGRQKSVDAPDSEAKQKEAIDLIQGAMGNNVNLAVLSFGRDAAIEQSPQSGKFAGFVNEVHGDASDLNGAIEKAMALIPRGAPGRLLMLSDGRWTGKDPSGVAAQAAARNIALDYRSMQRDSTNDVAISHIDAPEVVTPGESFMLAVWVRAPVPSEVSFELLRGNQRLAVGTRQVPSGLSRLIFRDKAIRPGTHQYTVRITGTETDPVPENNSAKILVGIEGPRPILHITTAADSGLARLLQAGGLDIKTAPQRHTIGRLMSCRDILLY